MRGRDIGREHSTGPPSPRDILSRHALARGYRLPDRPAPLLGTVVIRWYGILMALSIVVALWLCHRQARKREGCRPTTSSAWRQWAILAGLVGARLYEVIFNWDYYGRYPRKILAVWEGGLAIHGGLIVGPLVGVLLAWRWRVPILRGLDVAAPSLRHRAGDRPLGELLQRGSVRAADEPAVEALHLAASTGRRATRSSTTSIPTFLYESLWDLAMFILLVAWLRPRLREQPGALFFAYIGAVLDRPLPHRGHPPGQLLGRALPRRAAGEPRWACSWRSWDWPGRDTAPSAGCPAESAPRAPRSARGGSPTERRESPTMAVNLERVGPFLWRIPPDARRGMRVPALVVADDTLMAAIRTDASLEQIANGATLPGIVKAAARDARHPPGLRLPGRRRGGHRRRGTAS